MRKLGFLGFFLLILSGCVTLNVHKFYTYQLTPVEKTMIVPWYSSGVVGEFKDVLRSMGWKLIVSDKVEEETTGTIGEQTQIVTKAVSRANFKLVIVSRRSQEHCLGGYEYEASIVDLGTGEEALSLSGDGCLGYLSDDFRKSISETFLDVEDHQTQPGTANN